MHERRKHPRIPVTQPAALFRPDGSRIAECMLRDISIGGARIRVEPVADVPKRFSLQVPRGGKVKRQCEIVWQSKAEMGVRFVAAEQHVQQALNQDELAHDIALL